MSPDVANNWIAIVALIFSAFALAVSIYNAAINRPWLRIDVANDIIIFGAGPTEGPYFKVTVTNTGTQPTTITSIGLSSYEHAWTPKFGSVGKKAVLNGGGHSARLPRALGPGEYLDYFAHETDELHENFLSKPACYTLVWHSWATNPKTKRIKLVRKKYIYKNLIKM